MKRSTSVGVLENNNNTISKNNNIDVDVVKSDVAASTALCVNRPNTLYEVFIALKEKER